MAEKLTIITDNFKLIQSLQYGDGASQWFSLCRLAVTQGATRVLIQQLTTMPRSQTSRD